MRYTCQQNKRGLVILVNLGRRRKVTFAARLTGSCIVLEQPCLVILQALDLRVQSGDLAVLIDLDLVHIERRTGQLRITGAGTGQCQIDRSRLANVRGIGVVLGLEILQIIFQLFRVLAIPRLRRLAQSLDRGVRGVQLLLLSVQIGLRHIRTVGGVDHLEARLFDRLGKLLPRQRTRFKECFQKVHLITSFLDFGHEKTTLTFVLVV